MFIVTEQLFHIDDAYMYRNMLEKQGYNAMVIDDKERNRIFVQWETDTKPFQGDCRTMVIREATK